MSILSKVKSAVKKVASKVGSVAKGALASAITGGVSAKNTLVGGGAGNFPKTTTSSQTKTKFGPLTIYGPNNAAPVQSAVTLSGQKGWITPQGGGKNTFSPTYSQPSVTRTISPTQKNSNKVGSEFFNASINPVINSDVLGGNTSMQSSPGVSNSNVGSVSLPSNPVGGSVSPVSLAGNVTGNTRINPETGLLETVTVNEEGEETGDLSLQIQKALDLIPEKENLEDDREIRRQRREIQRRQEEVNNYQGQLNNIVAKQNADLLRLREIGSREGVTEPVYGGQELTINREAAIKALPIQAALSAAQGNLELAQDYLSELRIIKQEKIDNDYNYRKEQRAAVKEIADKYEKRQLDKMDKEEERAYDQKVKNLDEQDQWIWRAIENKQGNLASRISALDPESPTFRQDLMRIASAITPKDSGGGSTGPLSILDVARYQELYPKAKVIAGDSEVTANKKVSAAYGASTTSDSAISYQGETFIDEGVIEREFPQKNAGKTMNEVEAKRAQGYSDLEIYQYLSSGSLPSSPSGSSSGGGGSLDFDSI